MSQRTAQGDPMGFAAIQHYGHRGAAFYRVATEGLDAYGTSLSGCPRRAGQAEEDAATLVVWAMHVLGRAAEAEAFDPEPSGR